MQWHANKSEISDETRIKSFAAYLDKKDLQDRLMDMTSSTRASNDHFR